MAAIDKIYGTNAQWKEFYSWARENRPQILMYFYPFKGYMEEPRPITNLPEEEDMWLLNNCPLEFVTNYIKYQYDIEG